MADNLDITPGTGRTVATDQIGGVDYQRVKIGLGADGTAVDAVGGSGANGTGVQRFTIATDDTLVASLATKLDTLAGYLDTVEAKLQAIADDIVLATLTPPLPVGQVTNKMFSDATALTPKFAKIAASSSGANTIVAAVTSKKIRVLSYMLNANAAVNAKWQSHVTPTDLTGLLYCGAQGDGVCAGFNPVGWFETISGEALDLNLSGAVAVGGHITYIEV